MRAIKLVEGSGSPDTGACWMSALRMYEGGSWSDQPDCVCQVIRALCITLNDQLSSDEARGRIIGPYLFYPVGTKSTVEVMRQRAFLCADRAVRFFAADAMLFGGCKEQAAKLKALPQIADSQTASDARAAASAARAASDASYASYAARAASYASYAASYAARAASDASYAASYAASGAASYAASYAASDAASCAARAASDASDAASYASDASDASDASYSAERDKYLANNLLPLILDCCKIGTIVPVERACTKKKVREFCMVVERRRGGARHAT